MDEPVIMFAQVMIITMASIATFAGIILGSRILWRFGSRVKSSAPTESIASAERFHRLETAVDSIAIEVERISEAQRFMVGLLGESSQARRAQLPPTSRPERTNTPH